MSAKNHATEPQEESATVIIVGAPRSVIFVMDKLHRLGFVKISEWTLDENSNDPDQETAMATIVFAFNL